VGSYEPGPASDQLDQTHADGCEDQVAILPTLLNTNNWILLALACKTKPETPPLLPEGSVKAMTTNRKAFRKRKWWQSGEHELVDCDKSVEVKISSGHSIPKHLLDDLETLLNSRSAKDDPHNGTDQVAMGFGLVGAGMGQVIGARYGDRLDNQVRGRVPGLSIRDCARSPNNLVRWCPKLSATDLTARAIFERLYLVPGWQCK